MNTTKWNKWRKKKREKNWRKFQGTHTRNRRDFSSSTNRRHPKPFFFILFLISIATPNTKKHTKLNRWVNFIWCDVFIVRYELFYDDYSVYIFSGNNFRLSIEREWARARAKPFWMSETNKSERFGWFRFRASFFLYNKTIKEKKNKWSQTRTNERQERKKITELRSQWEGLSIGLWQW